MDWQTITAMCAVLIAAAWLVRRCWRIWDRAFSGGEVSDCGHCPRSKETTKSTPLVQLGTPKNSDK
jgi:hypothetical protein